MERRRQVERQDRIPLGDREFVDRRHELDAGVVDQDVDRAEFLDRPAHHRLDRVLLRQVGAVVAHFHRVIGGQFRAELLDFARVAEAVEDDVGAARGERGGDAEADAARRSGDECRFACGHLCS